MIEDNLIAAVMIVFVFSCGFQLGWLLANLRNRLVRDSEINNLQKRLNEIGDPCEMKALHDFRQQWIDGEAEGGTQGGK